MSHSSFNSQCAQFLAANDAKPMFVNYWAVSWCWGMLFLHWGTALTFIACLRLRFIDTPIHVLGAASFVVPRQVFAANYTQKFFCVNWSGLLLRIDAFVNVRFSFLRTDVWLEKKTFSAKLTVMSKADIFVSQITQWSSGEIIRENNSQKASSVSFSFSSRISLLVWLVRTSK